MAKYRKVRIKNIKPTKNLTQNHINKSTNLISKNQFYSKNGFTEPNLISHPSIETKHNALDIHNPKTEFHSKASCSIIYSPEQNQSQPRYSETSAKINSQNYQESLVETCISQFSEALQAQEIPYFGSTTHHNPQLTTISEESTPNYTHKEIQLTNNFRIETINLCNIKNKLRHRIVQIDTVSCKDRNPNLLIDTGAAISLIKHRFVKNIDKIDTSDVVKLTGITQEAVFTKGSYQIKIKTATKTISHNFHVVEDNFPIRTNGILGDEFFDMTKARICYKTKTLSFEGLTFDFLDFPNKITIEASQEKIIQIPTDIETPALIHAKKLKDGVLIGNSIIQPNMNLANICIINTNPFPVNIYSVNPDITPLSEFEIYKIEKEQELTKEKIVESTKDRLTKIIDEVKPNLHSDLNPEEIGEIIKFCKEFSDVFILDDEKLTTVPNVKHKITLYTDTRPIHVRQYPQPYAIREIINDEVKRMLNENIICHSTSPFNSPLLAVPKKPDRDGNIKWRVVVDFRKLNESTISDSYPLPLASDIFDQLGRAQYFSTVDMASGYHQIEMNPTDRHKTAFSTSHGHYEFLRMPFGLRNSQATFQRMINNAMMAHLGTRCFVYLDDIIVYGRTLQDHNEKLREIFKTLRANNLKVKTSKCCFLRREIQFLGHIIDKNGIRPNPKTIDAIMKFPTPKTAKQIKSFIGLSSFYRKFIPHFADIAEPLHMLTRKNRKFIWTDKNQIAFNTLKNKLIKPPILIYPDFDKIFTVTTDASNQGLGAILSQQHDNNDMPISYASRALKAAELNYSTVEKEMLAVKWAVQLFRPYLFGRKFNIITDHKPLISDLKNASKRIQKWHVELMQYDYTISHRPGKFTNNADALSRIPEANILNIFAITRSATTRKNMNPPINANQSAINNTLTQIPSHIKRLRTKCKVLIITNNNIKQRLLHEYHNSPLGGHSGIQRTYKRLRLKYFWKNMINDVKTHINTCQICKRNKYFRKERIPMEVTTTSITPFQRVALDIVGPLPITNKGNKYLLTFQDDLTKFSGAFPIKTQDANTIAETFCTKILTTFGAPDSILTDRGANFQGNVVKQICKILRIKHLSTTAFHPQTNGALERSHKTLKEYLRCFSEIDKNSWDKMIPYATFVYNTTPHSATNYTPYELMFARTANIPSSVKNEPEPIYSYDDYFNELKGRLRLAHSIARENIIKKKINTVQNYNSKTTPVTFSVGDFVYLKNNSPTNKLDQLYKGPYKITKVDSNVNSTIKVGRTELRVNNGRLMKTK